jgi:hypothetical protein
MMRRGAACALWIHASYRVIHWPETGPGETGIFCLRYTVVVKCNVNVDKLLKADQKVFPFGSIRNNFTVDYLIVDVYLIRVLQGEIG